jgi:hypothetical protein
MVPEEGVEPAGQGASAPPAKRLSASFGTEAERSEGLVPEEGVEPILTLR